MSSRKHVAVLLFFVVCCVGTSRFGWAARPAEWTLRADVRGMTLEGTPIDWSDKRVYLLARDGRLWDFSPDDAKNPTRIADSFRSLTTSEMRSSLERELGGKLEITSTGHYLVAHPKGMGTEWADRFENLYRSFVHYFTVRGFKLSEPKFPLVAIVWTNQSDYFRYAQSDGAAIGPGVLGYYSPTSNRVTLYEQGGGKKKAAWHENADTIIHEATHQTAFNTGLHTRFSLPPRWVVEGLGTLYEARGVWDSRNYKQQEDRINKGRLRNFKQVVASGRPTGLMVDLINSDRLFQENPGVAYAEAWALTFYLMETQPAKYEKYLALTAQRESFEAYPAAQRMKDFISVFGSDFRMLDSNLLRFVETLK